MIANVRALPGISDVTANRILTGLAEEGVHVKCRENRHLVYRPSFILQSVWYFIVIVMGRYLMEKSKNKIYTFVNEDLCWNLVIQY